MHLVSTRAASSGRYPRGPMAAGRGQQERNSGGGGQQAHLVFPVHLLLRLLSSRRGVTGGGGGLPLRSVGGARCSGSQKGLGVTKGVCFFRWHIPADVSIPCPCVATHLAYKLAQGEGGFRAPPRHARAAGGQRGGGADAGLKQGGGSVFSEKKRVRAWRRQRRRAFVQILLPTKKSLEKLEIPGPYYPWALSCV